MVGGLVVSQLLTLYITPVIYLYLERFQQWLRAWMGRANPRLAREARDPGTRCEARGTRSRAENPRRTRRDAGHATRDGPRRLATPQRNVTQGGSEHSFVALARRAARVVSGMTQGKTRIPGSRG